MSPMNDQARDCTRAIGLSLSQHQRAMILLADVGPLTNEPMFHANPSRTGSRRASARWTSIVPTAFDPHGGGQRTVRHSMLMADVSSGRMATGDVGCRF